MPAIYRDDAAGLFATQWLPRQGATQSHPAPDQPRASQQPAVRDCGSDSGAILGGSIAEAQASRQYITEGKISIDGTELQGTDDKKLGMD